MARPFVGEPTGSVEAATSPSTMIGKYSAEPKESASSAMSGANPMTSRIATVDPTELLIAVTKSASAARPFRASGYPSRQVTAAVADPGRLSRIDAVEPPYCVP